MVTQQAYVLNSFERLAFHVSCTKYVAEDSRHAVAVFFAEQVACDVTDEDAKVGAAECGVMWHLGPGRA